MRAGGGDALCRRLEFAGEVGAQMVATVSGPAVRRDAFLDHLAQATKLAEQLGVTIALENPADDVDAALNDGADAAQIAAAVDHPLVRINYDPGNFLTHRPGQAAHVDIEPALPYCIGLHLKDLRQEEKAGCILPSATAASCGMCSTAWRPLPRSPCSASIPARESDSRGKSYCKRSDAPGPDRDAPHALQSARRCTNCPPEQITPYRGPRHEKFVNDPMNVVDEMLEGFLFVNQRYVSAHPAIAPSSARMRRRKGRRHYRRRFRP